MTSGWAAPFVLAVPLLLAFLAAFAWDLRSRPAEPPRFAGYAVRPGWKVDPTAVLDQDLRHERLSYALVAVRDRLVEELTDHHGLLSTDIRGGAFRFPKHRDPTIDRACGTVRALEDTCQIAYLAEDPRRTDLWSKWRRPAWRSLARRRFEAELSEIESLWPLLDPPS